MKKLHILIKQLEPLLKAENDELNDLIPDQEGKDKLIELVNDFEAKIAKQLREQCKFFVKALESYVEKSLDSSTLLAYLASKVYPEDNFGMNMEKVADDFMLMSLNKLIPIHMNSIDKDVAFNQKLSQKTQDWVSDWSPQLGNLMKLSTHTGVGNLILTGLENGWGIEKIVTDLKDLPQFTRNRARATAITEVLTANSASAQEAYRQSPSVDGKRWLHSGTRKIQPRSAHVALNDKISEVEKYFNVNGYNAMYPRDTSLPASERVNCHCTLAPAIDQQILGLSEKDRQEIRDAVLENREPNLSSSVPPAIKKKARKKRKAAAEPDENGWRGATTVLDLNEKFKKVHDFTFERMDTVSVETVKGIAARTDKVLKKYPELKSYSKFLMMDGQEDIEGAYGFVFKSERFGKTVMLNPKWFDKDNFTKFTEADIEDQRKKEWLVNSEGVDGYSVITHEFGHVMVNYLNSKKWWKKVGEPEQELTDYLLHKTLRESKVSAFNIEKELSQYSTYNQDEFFAECFSEYVDGKNPRKLAATFGKQLELILEKVGDKK